MAARLNLPHSPVHEPRVFDPPSPIPNLWEDLDSWALVDEEEEEDYGGGGHDDDEDKDDDEEYLPFWCLLPKGE
jgi:diadenosine tetraphosphatase ApaH/serine/threonine PP2A family protein phosphatase